jgi:hypothetical protein
MSCGSGCGGQVGLNMWVWLGRSSEYTDLASLAALPKYTCGQLYFYPGFSAQRDGRKLTHELSHNLTRPTGLSLCQINPSTHVAASTYGCTAAEEMVPCTHWQFIDPSLVLMGI